MAKITDRTAFDGETLHGVFDAPDGTTAVSVKISDGIHQANKAAIKGADGRWAVTISASEVVGMSGPTRWIAMATTADGEQAINGGEIFIRSLVSKYRAVVAAVEQALQNYGNNPNKSISVGEVSITYKDYNDLLAILGYWQQRVKQDEAGQKPAGGGVQFVKVRF